MMPGTEKAGPARGQIATFLGLFVLLVAAGTHDASRTVAMSLIAFAAVSVMYRDVVGRVFVVVAAVAAAVAALIAAVSELL